MSVEIDKQFVWELKSFGLGLLILVVPLGLLTLSVITQGITNTVIWFFSGILALIFAVMLGMAAWSIGNWIRGERPRS